MAPVGAAVPRGQVNLFEYLSGGGSISFAKFHGLLLHKPDILLLNKPAKDLDVNTLLALEEGLENFSGCAVVISHDRWFLDRIVTNMLAFKGDRQVVWFEGNYSTYEAERKRHLDRDADQTNRSLAYE